MVSYMNKKIFGKTLKHWSHYPLLVIIAYLSFQGLTKYFHFLETANFIIMLLVWTGVITFVDTAIHKFYLKEAQ